MYDTTTIPSKHKTLTASSDDLGEYGSIFTSDSDREIPQPLNLYDETTPGEIGAGSNAARLQ
jgi:hypothetical protein